MRRMVLGVLAASLLAGCMEGQKPEPLPRYPVQNQKAGPALLDPVPKDQPDRR